MRSTSLTRFQALSVAVPLALFVAATGCGVSFDTGVEAKEAWTKTYKVNAGATLELREPNGQIRVSAGEGDQVVVNATRIVKGPTEEAAKKVLADVTIKESGTPDKIEIDSSGPSQGGIFNRLSRRVDYDVTMPRTGQLTIKATNGEITVRSIEGFIKIETTNGDIELTGLSKGADVDATNGRVQIEASAIGEGGIKARTTNGQIIVTIPKSANATLNARVTNGVVETENLSVQSSDSSHRRLEGTIGSGGPEIRLETTNGEVKIRGRD